MGCTTCTCTGPFTWLGYCCQLYNVVYPHASAYYYSTHMAGLHIIFILIYNTCTNTIQQGAADSLLAVQCIHWNAQRLFRPNWASSVQHTSANLYICNMQYTWLHIIIIIQQWHCMKRHPYTCLLTHCTSKHTPNDTFMFVWASVQHRISNDW